jgi:hypothetical protein
MLITAPVAPVIGVISVRTMLVLAAIAAFKMVPDWATFAGVSRSRSAVRILPTELTRRRAEVAALGVVCASLTLRTVYARSVVRI